MNNNEIDLNVNNYSQEDLLELLSLNDTEQVTYDDIIDASTPLINKYTSDDNYDLSNFFQQVQNQLLEDIDITDADDSNNIKNNSTSQLGALWQNQNVSQKAFDPVQANKTTDRKHQVQIFNQDDHFIMNRNQLGINNSNFVPVSQGQLNPNLKNTTTRLVSIDSQYRENIFPFNSDPDSPTSPTNFTLDLSDPIHNAISMKLTAYQIPCSWYVIDAEWRSNNFFFITDSSNVNNPYCINISSGNYTQEQLIQAIKTNIDMNVDISNVDISYNPINGKTTITNNTSNQITVTFYDPTGKLVCNTNCKTSPKSNNNLGWILGYRGNTTNPTSNPILSTDPLYGQMIYNIDPSGSIISEAFMDIFGPKYFLIVLDDYQQNHLNRGVVGITPTQKYVEIPTYWNADLAISSNGCTTASGSSKKTPTYVQNTPRRLTQAQLFTLNSTTQSRSQTQHDRLIAPTNTNVLALIPLRGNFSIGSMLTDDFNVGGSERVYFGPVDLERMRIRLIDDQGYTVNLNGNNWSFTLLVTSLYQY
jgi:hypothetical protein